MFYDVFSSLCREKGVRPSRAAEECGINKSNVSNWKNNGYVPRGEALDKIARYFNVSVDYLLGNADTKKEPTVKTDDDELNEYLEELKNRPEMQMLFSLAKGASKEDVEKAVKIVEALFEK